MSNIAKISLGFQVDEQVFTDESTSIYNKSKAFINAQPEGSYMEFGTTSKQDGSFINLTMHIVVVDMDNAKTKRDNVYSAITALDIDGNPVFPPLMNDDKGWHFVYEENGVPVVTE